MKKFNFHISLKKGQSLIEFILIAALVGIVSFWAFYKLNPQFFRSYFKGSVSSAGNIDSSGQLTMQSMDDSSSVTAGSTCVAMAIGGVEADGSIYAGNSSGKDLCITVFDTGVYTWNKGVAGTIGTGITDLNDGEANTAALTALSNSESPYNAAFGCKNETSNGHNDWYLPARNELSVLMANKALLPNFVVTANAVTQFYWSSSEENCGNGRSVDFFNSTNVNKPKLQPHSVRCVRHD